MTSELLKQIPTAFISYSWDSEEHKEWVKRLGARLRSDGIDLILDEWKVAPGDQLPQFMETAIRDSDFVLMVCTPKYKEKSDRRIGGVGYEGHIITAEVMTERNDRKFVPLLRSGDWREAATSILRGKVYIDLRGDPYLEGNYLYSFFELRQVEDPMLHAGVYPQLLDTGPHAGHGLPVIRIKPLLNQVQLMACEASGSFWESSQILEGGAYPEELLPSRKTLYNFQHTGASRGRGTA